MPAPSPGIDGQFPTTEWTLVSRLRSRDEAVACRVLNELVTQYYYPLYCFIRRRGMDHHDAEDALHDFLGKLLRLDAGQRANQAAGRLRGYLSTALRNFLSTRFHEPERAPVTLSLDASAAEARYVTEELRDEDTPERLVGRKWVYELLREVMRKLGATYATRDRLALFQALQPFIFNGGTLRGEDAPAIAEKLGMTPVALRVAMSRLMEAFRIALRAEVLHTLEDPAGVDDELASLIRAFET